MRRRNRPRTLRLAQGNTRRSHSADTFAMLSCLNCITARRRAGLAFSMSDIYGSISADLSDSSVGLGDISKALLAGGLTVEAVRSALNTVSAGLQGNPQQMAALNAELNYLNTYGAAPPQSSSRWILPALLIGGLIFWAMNEKK